VRPLPADFPPAATREQYEALRERMDGKLLLAPLTRGGNLPFREARKAQTGCCCDALAAAGLSATSKDSAESVARKRHRDVS